MPEQRHTVCYKYHIKQNIHNTLLGCLRTLGIWSGFCLFIVAAQGASSVSLAWTANSQTNVSGYRINYGTATGNYTGHLDVGNVTTGTIYDLVDSTTYFIALTAYNAAGVESPPSNEISYTTSGTLPPPSPTPNPTVTPTPAPTVTPTPAPTVTPTPGPSVTPTPPSPTPLPTVTPRPTTPPPIGTPTPLPALTFESTQGVITPPFTRNADHTISQAVETDNPINGGKAVYAFTIRTSGPYAVSINVNAPNTGANSIFANIDGEPVSPTMIWDTPVTSGFQRNTITWRGTAGLQKVWSLSAGPHQLILRGREANLKLGQITISQSLNTASPTPPPARQTLLNVATRTFVQNGQEVMIGGFIITGDNAKKVIVRGIGPSLSRQGIVGAMADPTLELHDSTGHLVATNDNWTSQRNEVQATGLAPTDNRESAIVATLPPGSYTCILQSKTGSPGVGLFELYDLDAASSHLVNISTRGKVGLGENVVIGGFIIGGDQSTKVLVRAIGPSLTRSGVSNALQDPKLELHGPTGALIFTNDNWRSAQQQQIEETQLQPTDNREAAIIATLAPGTYTAIVRGSGNLTGIALVEVYNLDN